MLLEVILLLIGFFLLYVSANYLVSSSSNLAKSLNIPRAFIGATIVAFGTSSPEFVVSVVAVKTQPDIALGNVVGSNIANIAIAIGLSALINPLFFTSSIMKKKSLIMLFSVFLFFILVADGKFGLFDALISLIYLVLFIYLSFSISHQETNREEVKSKNVIKNIIILIISLGVLLFGAELAVSKSIIIAQELGVSEKFIGLTIIAVGTSLPEITVSVVAAWKKEADLSVGNVIGSNVFNLCGILGVAGLIAPIPVGNKFLIDLGVMFIFSALLLPIITSRSKISRREGSLLILIYLSYLVFLIWNR